MLSLDKEYYYQVPYKHITYGELFNIVNLEGLSLCNEYRLRKLKERRKDIGKQVGSFCELYGFSKKDVAPSIKRRRREDRLYK